MADKVISKIQLHNVVYQLRDNLAARQADLAALQEKVNAFLDAEGIKESTLDTLSEIQEFITSEAAAADELVKSVSENTAAITAILDGTTPIDVSYLSQKDGDYIIWNGGTATTVI